MTWSKLEEITRNELTEPNQELKKKIRVDNQPPINVTYQANSAGVKPLLRQLPIKNLKITTTETTNEANEFTQWFREWRGSEDSYGDFTRIQTEHFTIGLDGANSQDGHTIAYIASNKELHAEHEKHYANTLFNIFDLKQDPNTPKFQKELIYFPRKKQRKATQELIKARIPFKLYTTKTEQGPHRLEEQQFYKDKGIYTFTRQASLERQGMLGGGLKSADFKEAEGFIKSIHPSYENPQTWDFQPTLQLVKNPVD